MSSVFTKIIEGELPGRFVWADEQCVAFLSIQPLAQGHVLVVPRREVDAWIDLPEELATHLMTVSRAIGRAVDAAFSPKRVGLMIQGFEVAHTHLHVWPTNRSRSSTSRTWTRTRTRRHGRVRPADPRGTRLPGAPGHGAVAG